VLASLAAVCRRTCEDSGADGASVSLVTGGLGLSPLWASDYTGERLEERQLTLGEGPCPDAVATGGPVLVDDLHDPDREGPTWPGFAPEVEDLDIGGNFAFPIQVGPVALGCLQLYRRSAGGLSETELAAALRGADTLAAVLLGLAASADGDEMVPPCRQVVHQAAGVMTVQRHLSIEEAMLRLRARAYSEQRSIESIAADVVEGSEDLFEGER